MEAIPLPLRYCFLGDKVLLVLSRFNHNRELTHTERDTLSKALGFLETILHGEELVEELRLDENVIEASSAYGVALDIISNLKQEGEFREDNFNQILNNYINAIKELEKYNEKETSTKDDLQSNIRSLESFFKKLREISLKRLARSAERVSFVG